MRLVIECLDPNAIIVEIITILMAQQIELEHIQFEKWNGNPAIMLTIRSIAYEKKAQLFTALTPINGLISVSHIDPPTFPSPSDSLYPSQFHNIIAHSPKMKILIEKAQKFALLDAPLLIEGETGTGKDYLAKICHQFGLRRNNRFIAVNCAGLPEENAETEMFGGKTQGGKNIGFFEYAHGGTVLLDAVAELSLEMQAKLLRFLNDGIFRRVGEDHEIKVNVRVICTSQRPLITLVNEGKMREDLFHRLNVLHLIIPPLRERKEDFDELVAQFVSNISQQLGIDAPYYDHHFLATLKHYHFSGNLRELHNILYRACCLGYPVLNIKHLELTSEPCLEWKLAFDSPHNTLDELVKNFESSILSQLYTHYPSTRKLAKRLGISHTTIANKLRAYGITK